MGVEGLRVSGLGLRAFSVGIAFSDLGCLALLVFRDSGLFQGLRILRVVDSF